MIASSIAAVVKLGGSALGIIDKFVEDKDLKQKLAIRQLELTYGLAEKLINATTVPWVDASVKLLTATMIFARPLGSFALTCAGIYMHFKNIPMDATVHGALDLAFPTWGAAREVHKSREEKTKRQISSYENLAKWD